jgi:site-specific recombinase XerD
MGLPFVPAAVLGHTNINTTAVYLQFNDRDLRDVYANVPF